MLYYRNRPIDCMHFWSVVSSQQSDRVGLTIHFRRSRVGLTFRGDTAELLRQHLKGNCPVGVLIDHIEEHPENVTGNRKLHEVIVAYYRSKYRCG